MSICLYIILKNVYGKMPKIKFKQISINDAEILYKLYELETKNISSFI